MSTRAAATSSPPAREPARDAPREAQTPAPAPALAAASLLVDDEAAPRPGQEQRRAFLAALEPGLRRALDEELAPIGRTSADCPFLATWLARLRTEPVDRAERLLRRVAGAGDAATAAELSNRLLAWTREAARAWRARGAAGVDLDPALAAELSSPFAVQRAAEGTPAQQLSAEATLLALGPGRPIDPGPRARLEAAFEVPLGSLRLHDDAHAGALARAHGAAAFAVGPHLAFAEGRYAPGTLRGDALLAHEVAHGLQQRGASASRPAGDGARLERDADRAAATALLGGRARVGAAGGLSIRRCSAEAPAEIPTEVDPSRYDDPTRAVDASLPPAYRPPGARAAAAAPSMGERLTGSDPAARAAALRELEAGSGEATWRALLLASDVADAEVRARARALISTRLRSDAGFRAFLVRLAESPEGSLSDLAIRALAGGGRGADVPLERYRSVVLQRVEVARSQLADLRERLTRLRAGAGRAAPAAATAELDALARRARGGDLDAVSDAGLRASTLLERLGVIRGAVEQITPLLPQPQSGAATAPATPTQTRLASTLDDLLVAAAELPGPRGDAAFERVMSAVRGLPAEVADAAVTQLLDAFRGAQRSLADAMRSRPLPSFRTAFGNFSAQVLTPLRDQLGALVSDLEGMAPHARTDPQGVIEHLRALEPALRSIADRTTYALQAVQMMHLYAGLALTDEAAKDAFQPTELALKGLFADLATLAALRDRDPELAAQQYQQIMRGERLRNAVRDIRQWEEIQAGEMRFAMLVLDILTIVASIYTAGLAGGVVRGLLGRALTGFGRFAIGTAVFATEVTAFHLSQRGFRWALHGEAFYDERFWEEYGETALMFGVLRGTGAAYRRFISPRLPAPLRAAGGHTSTFLAFQAWSVAQTWRHTGQLLGPTDAAFWRLAAHNAVFLAAIHLGMSAARPLVAPLESRVLQFRLERHNGRSAELERAIAAFRATPEPAAQEAVSLLRRARAIYLERLDVLREIARLEPSQLTPEELRYAEQVLRANAEACENAVAQARLRLRAHESNADVYYYEGEVAAARRHFEGRGYTVVEVDAATGRMRLRSPEGQILDLIRSSERPTGASSRVGEADARLAARYEVIRGATAQQVRDAARRYGIPQQIAQRVHRHLFLTEYDLPTAPGQTRRMRFEPLGEIADLWEGALEGRLSADQALEFKWLLAHEYVESHFMARGMSYRSLDPLAWLGETVDVAPGRFGAHDLAPNPNQRNAPFSQYRRMGVSAEGLALDPRDPLRNIEDVIRRIEEARRQPVREPTVDEWVDMYEQALARLRRALDAHDAAETDAAYRELNGIESIAERTLQPGAPAALRPLPERLLPLRQIRAAVQLLERPGSALPQGTPTMESPERPGTTVLSTGYVYTTSTCQALRVRLRGRTYADVRAEIGRAPDAVERPASPGARASLAWVFDDGSVLRIEFPAASGTQARSGFGRRVAPNGVLGVTENGVGVARDSDAARIGLGDASGWFQAVTGGGAP